VPAPPVASTSKGSLLPPTPLSQPPPAPKKTTKTTKQTKIVPSKPLSAPSYEGLFDSDSDDEKKILPPSPLTPRPNLTLSFIPTRMISRPFGITIFLMKPSGLPALLLLLLWVQDLSCFNALILISSNFEMVLLVAGLFSPQTLPFLL